jgi:hypothetical protein
MVGFLVGAMMIEQTANVPRHEELTVGYSDSFGELTPEMREVMRQNSLNWEQMVSAMKVRDSHSTSQKKG